MKTLTLFYILNGMLLLLHEIESAYEKEWEILKLPGKITGFIILHIPIILVIFYGLLEIDKQTKVGLIIGIITGIGGLIPFVVHKIAVRTKENFDKLISNILIFSNIITGMAVIVLSVYFIA